MSRSQEDISRAAAGMAADILRTITVSGEGYGASSMALAMALAGVIGAASFRRSQHAEMVERFSGLVLSLLETVEILEEQEALKKEAAQ